MAAPYPRRGPQQGVARAVNRGSKGMAQGRFSGLGAVQQTQDAGRPELGGLDWQYDNFDYYFATLDTSAIGSVTTNSSFIVAATTSADPDKAWVEDGGSGTFRVLRSGLYVVEAGITGTGTAGSGYVRTHVGGFTLQCVVAGTGGNWGSEVRPPTTRPFAAGDTIAFEGTNKTAASITVAAADLSITPIFFA